MCEPQEAGPLAPATTSDHRDRPFRAAGSRAKGSSPAFLSSRKTSRSNEKKKIIYRCAKRHKTQDHKTRARACVPQCRSTPLRAVSCVQFVTRAWKSRRPRYIAQSVLVESLATGAELRTSPHFCLPSLLSPAPKRGRENADRLLRQHLLQSVLRRVCTVQSTLAMSAQPPVSTLIKDKAWRFAMTMCCGVPEVCDTLRGWTRTKRVPSRTPRGTKSSQLLRNYVLIPSGKFGHNFFFPILLVKHTNKTGRG